MQVIELREGQLRDRLKPIPLQTQILQLQRRLPENRANIPQQISLQIQDLKLRSIDISNFLNRIPTQLNNLARDILEAFGFDSLEIAAVEDYVVG